MTAPEQMIQFAIALAVQDAVAFLRRVETISTVIYGAAANAVIAAAPDAKREPGTPAPPPGQTLGDIADATEKLLAAATANLARLCDAATKYGPQPAQPTSEGDKP